ncbi:type I DNA topoisomerase [Aquifex pyrophilus]
MKLFIVESPTKAKTIQKFLGREFVVKATLGHIKDLPERELGVDLKTLKAKYVYRRGKKKLIESLKKLAKKAEIVYIATDPDREGEAIAYFVKEDIKKANKNVKRAVFYEVTKKAIEESIRNAGDINMNLVYAQFARRILDRLIGYLISPILWREFKNYRLSAGRVQSPALRLIVEREREIQSFKVKKYYYVNVLLEKDGKRFKAVYDYRYENPSDAKIIAQKLEKGFFSVYKAEERKENVAPPKPFITSDLQAEANAKLGYAPERTQKLAQELYEKGYITYPRTDSYRMNEEIAKKFMEYIRERFGERYVGRLRKFREKKTAQGAHECIRPTKVVEEIPEREELRKLYELIFRRTLSSLFSDMEILRQKATIEAITPELKHPVHLIAKGLKIVHDGWSKVYPTDIKEEPLPELEEGELLKLVKVFLEEKKTQPPPRYTEGTLVKTLEKLGIGRPSTYAVIVKTLKERGYVEIKNKSLYPTDIASQVVDFLMEKFPLLMDYKFTSLMEEKLDLVEEGKINWKSVVYEFANKVLGKELLKV